MKNQDKIVKNILGSFKDKLVSKKQLETTFRDVLQESYSKNIIVKLRKKKEIIYVFKGYYYLIDPREKEGRYTEYSTNEMVYTILNKLNIKWYLGLFSAIEKNNINWQGVVKPIIINSDFSGAKKILGINYRFHKMKRELFSFGFIKKKTKNRITYYYSDPEKTLIDFFYFKKNIPSELIDIKLNKNTKEYLKHYPKSFKKELLYS